LTAVKQLSSGELREFPRGFADLIEDGTGENGRKDRDEEVLLSTIRKNSVLAAKEQRRFERLRKKRQAERLTAAEAKESQEIWQCVEEMNAARLVALAELASLRGVKVKRLMVEAGRKPE
jgi:hypothetical protein